MQCFFRLLVAVLPTLHLHQWSRRPCLWTSVQASRPLFPMQNVLGSFLKETEVVSEDRVEVRLRKGVFCSKIVCGVRCLKSWCIGFEIKMLICSISIYICKPFLSRITIHKLHSGEVCNWNLWVYFTVHSMAVLSPGSRVPEVVFGKVAAAKWSFVKCYAMCDLKIYFAVETVSIMFKVQ